MFLVLTVNAQKQYSWEIQQTLYNYFYPNVGKKITLYEYVSDTITYKIKIKTKRVWLDSMLCYSKEDTVIGHVFNVTDESPMAKYFYQKNNFNNKGYFLKAYFSDKRKDGKGKVYEFNPLREILAIIEKQDKLEYYRGLKLYYDPIENELVFKERSIYINKLKRKN